MALTTHRWTRADLERLPDDGNKYELIHGELLVTPAPRPAHEYLISVLARRLASYCDEVPIADAFAGNSAFVTDDSEVIPDIVVRQRTVPPPARWDDAPRPILLVEVLSESTRRADLVRKRAFYMETGIPEYWIVDGLARTIRVITPDGERIESKTLRWLPAGASYALEINLPALFAAVLGA